MWQLRRYAIRIVIRKRSRWVHFFWSFNKTFPISLFLVEQPGSFNCNYSYKQWTNDCESIITEIPKLNWTLDEILKHHTSPMLDNKMSDNGTLIYKRVGWKARNRSTQSVKQIVALHKRSLWRPGEIKRKIELFKDRVKSIDSFDWPRLPDTNAIWKKL